MTRGAAGRRDPGAARPRRAPVRRGRRGRQAVHHPARQDQADPGGAMTAGRTCSACTGPARCSASCRCSTPVPARPARRPSPTPRWPGWATTTCGSWLSSRPEVAMHMLRRLAQRLRRINDIKADLVFTDVPGRVAKALLDLASAVRHPAGGRHPGQSRPDPGGAGPARRRLPGDRQQGAGRLRRPRLGPAVGQVGAAGRHRPAAQAGQLARLSRLGLTPGGTSPGSPGSRAGRGPTTRRTARRSSVTAA